MIKSLDEVIERLQYKADNIKAKLEPSYFTECIDYLKSLPREEGQWIPCSERLPEVNKRVMCFTTNETYTFAEYGGPDSHYLSNKDVWFSDKGWYRKDGILAWQPLPEPYKGEQE